MKKILTTLSVLIALFATGTAFAQTSASANATANIVASIAITKTVDLQFGNVVATTGAATTVILSTAGARTGTAVRGNGSTVSAASFSVTGDGTSTYAIVLPADGIVELTAAAGAPMPVSAFNSDPSGTGTLTAGAQTLLVGATLNVGAAQVSNPYSGTFNVSVAYN